jgi:hypothetical protein
MEENEKNRAYLQEIAYEQLPENTPDIGGWEVVTEDGKKVGEVHALLGDAVARRVRYIDVDLDDELVQGEEKHVLIPIGTARFQQEEGKIVLSRLISQDLTALPSYQHGAITRDYEDSIRKAYQHEYIPNDPTTEDYYQGGIYDDTELYRAQGRV